MLNYISSLFPLENSFPRLISKTIRSGSTRETSCWHFHFEIPDGIPSISFIFLAASGLSKI
jgi:hypothetical protein